ncbi:hypothetical protein, partial [Acinetobacter venetianus]|uniref:hypothetical protein n=1 Tax=Acinetobacter venetianus TaxID=52133 RepID=UPI000B07502C
MFENLLESRKLLVTYIEYIKDLKIRADNDNYDKIFIELLNVLRRKLIKLITFIDNVLKTSEGKVLNDSSTSFLIKNLSDEDKNIKLIGMIKEFNYNFLRLLTEFGNDLY